MADYQPAFNTITVPEEVRLIVVREEQRMIEVSGEIREIGV